MNGDRAGEGRSLAPLMIKGVIVLALVLLAVGVWRKLRIAPAADGPVVSGPPAAATTPRAVVETPVTRWASLDNLFIQRPVISPGDELEIVAQWRFGADAGRWIHIDCEIRLATDAAAPPLPCAMSAENRNTLLLPLRPGSYQFSMKWALDGHPSEQRKLRFDVIERGASPLSVRGAGSGGGAGATWRSGPGGAATTPARTAPPAASRDRRDRTPEEQMDDLSRR